MQYEFYRLSVICFVMDASAALSRQMFLIGFLSLMLFVFVVVAYFVGSTYLHLQLIVAQQFFVHVH